MFENIGGKIKALAKVLCWVGIIASVISGIVMISNGSRSYGYYNSGAGAVAGIITIIVGSLASWIGSFFTYGFGQLIENTDAMKRILENVDRRTKD